MRIIFYLTPLHYAKLAFVIIADSDISLHCTYSFPLPIGPLAARPNTGPNVSPLSLLDLNIGSLPGSSHHVTYTLLPSTASCALSEKPVEELLILIVSSNVCPPSVLLVNKTSQFPVLLSHHIAYTLLPDSATFVSI